MRVMGIVLAATLAVALLPASPSAEAPEKKGKGQSAGKAENLTAKRGTKRDTSDVKQIELNSGKARRSAE